MFSGASLIVPSALTVTAIAAAVDARTGHIPNWLTLPVLGIAPVFAFASGYAAGGVGTGVAMLGTSLLGAFLCALGPVVAFMRGGLGGGDVKLLAAIGALLGPRWGIDVEVTGFVLGALYVPAKLAWKGVLAQTCIGLLRMLKNPFLPRAKRLAMPVTLRLQVRLGPAILAGLVLIVLVSRGAP